MNALKDFEEIDIQIDSLTLKGSLRFLGNSKGFIIFSHGSGSSRLSSRNNYVADLLLEQRFSSLLFDLLTMQEDLFYENRFNIELLTERLVKVTHWVQQQEKIKELPIGYFGASTGAASALYAASQLGPVVKAVVSRGGRPDLAMKILDGIKIPTLLLVGGNDDVVIELNKKAQSAISGICELNIIDGASHLFEEPGKLKIVAKQTSDWFDKYLNG